MNVANQHSVHSQKPKKYGKPAVYARSTRKCVRDKIANGVGAETLRASAQLPAELQTTSNLETSHFEV